MREEPEGGAAIAIDKIEKFSAFFVVAPGTVGLEAKQFVNTESGFATAEILRGNAEMGKILFGDVDATEGIVLVNVTNDVGELEGQTELFGEVESSWVAEAEDVRAGEADSAGDAVAIFAETVEGGIGADSEVHFGAGDEVVEVACRHMETLHGVHEGGEDFALAGEIAGGERAGSIAIEDLRLAGHGFVESGAPSCEAALLLWDVADFIGNVINQAHEGVEGNDTVAARFRKEEESGIEAAVGGASDLVARIVRDGDGEARN